MIRLCFIFLFLLQFSVLSFAQIDTSCKSKAGVYLNSVAFDSNTFTDSIFLNNKMDRITMGNNSIIKLNSKKNGQKRYEPGDIFGYSDGTNKYRFFYDDKNEGGPFGYFKLEEINGLLIYSQWALHGGTSYFYSKDLDSPIKELLKKNLDRDFPNEDFSREVLSLKNLNKNKEAVTKLKAIYLKYYSKNKLSPVKQ